MRFPNDFIPASKKDEKWCLEWVKAAWADFDRSGGTNFYFNTKLAPNGTTYEQIAAYMDGRQPVDKYKPRMGVDETSNESYLNIDWKILPIVPKFVRICLGLLDKQQYGIGFFPLDALAKSDKEEHFRKQRAKLMMRNAAMEVDPSMVKEAGLEQSPGEPEDDEELMMQEGYTYRHIAAIEMEQDVTSIMSANQVDKLRKLVRKDMLYYGVGGYKDCIDQDGTLRIRKVRPHNLVVPSCLNNDFTDCRYIGEVIELTLAEYAQMDQGATPEFIIEQANRHMNSFGNPGRVCSGYSEALTYKIAVLDLEWQSVDTYIYDVGTNQYGNMAVSKSKPRNGVEQVRRRFKMIYQAKWVLGTERIFAWGRQTDMKRPRAQLSEVLYSYHILSPDFTDGNINSIGAQVVPLADQIQLDWLNFQKFKAEAKGWGVDIEMGALEDINYGKGGSKLMPHDVVDLFEKKFTLLWRKSDRSGKDRNFRPINMFDGGGLSRAMEWVDSIQFNIGLLKQVFGLNDFTDASTPDPRALTNTSNAAIQSTNNSLFGLIQGDVALMESLAGSIVIRLQDMADMGLLDRYKITLGDASVDFIKRSHRLSHYDLAIKIKQVASEEEKVAFLQDLKTLFGAEMITMEDVVVVKNTDDLKVAEVLLAYRLKKRMEKKQQDSMMLQQQNAQVQMESAKATEEEKRRTQEDKIRGMLMLEDKKGEWAVRVAEIKADSDISGKIISKTPENIEQNS